MIIFFGILVMGVVAFFIHLFASKVPRTPYRIVRLFLLYQLVFTGGLICLLSFYGLMFMSDYVAALTDWPACPFIKQLANVNLGYGVLGIMCIWMGDEFWLATIIGQSIWLFADGIGHIADAILHNNYSSGNIGVPLYVDLIIPIVFVSLYILYRNLKKSRLSEIY